LKSVVLCIPGFASSARQYGSLGTRLAPRYGVVTGDLYGHGERAPWTGETPFTLAHEAAFFAALLPQEGPVHLVGHSYGAAVALHIAREHRSRIRSMALYEPTMWGTLAALCKGEPATLEIEAVRDDTNRLIEAGEMQAAAERFVDYWAGTGAWDATPAERKPRLLAAVRALPDGWNASFGESWSAADLQALDVPSLLMTGSRSTAAARRAVQLLGETLPDAELLKLEGLGHLGPLTHPTRVDEAVEAFISERSQPWVHSQPLHTA
jgi:pimeloyl-ACP methyl ester carboxylesterase